MAEAGEARRSRKMAEAGEAGRSGKTIVLYGFMFFAFLYMLTSIALESAILGMGLRGKFATTGPVETADDGVHSLTQEQEEEESPGLFVFPLKPRMYSKPPSATVGKCATVIYFQGEYNHEGCESLATDQERWSKRCFEEGVPEWDPKHNLMLEFPDPDDCSVSVSTTWTIAGWNTTFVQLAPGATFVPPKPYDTERTIVKILRGSLLDIDFNGVQRDDGRWQSFPVTVPNRVASLWLPQEIREIEASEEGAAFVYYKVPKSILNSRITDVNAFPANEISGQWSEYFRWQKFGLFDETFVDVDFWNLGGFLIRNHDKSRLAYLQWWALREDEDAGEFHNEDYLDGINTFSEISMSLYTASATSGIQTTVQNTQNLGVVENPDPDAVAPEDFHKYFMNDQKEVAISLPMPPGSVHGPLWAINSTTGEPLRQCNGGVLYPLHRWLSGPGKGMEGYNTEKRYSMWVSVEHSPKYTKIPSSMISSWRNAELQTQMDPPKCA